MLRIPRRLWRLRLACIWPIWIGLATLARLRTANPLDPRQRVMVPQAEVNLLLLKSVLFVASDSLLSGVYRTLRQRAIRPVLG